MHMEGDTWVCCSCANEEPRDSEAEAAMTTQDGQRDDAGSRVRRRTATATGPTTR
jgi:DNA-directed RNA polymerase subunit M